MGSLEGLQRNPEPNGGQAIVEGDKPTGTALMFMRTASGIFAHGVALTLMAAGPAAYPMPKSVAAAAGGAGVTAGVERATA